MRIVPPTPVRPITQNDLMLQEFRTWTQNVSKLGILSGSGSPETVEPGEQTQLYMDTAGTAGSILYIKKLADIGGDTTQGWILV